MSVMKLAVGENIYDRYRRIILDHLDGHYDYFSDKYFLSVVYILSDQQVANTAQLLLNFKFLMCWLLTFLQGKNNHVCVKLFCTL